ncbi:hypothetical protein TNCV_2005271 [Trichonephila clavipes]|nr:hypothetical protein TNCV_2005271 [Trichonephila clavipes]
MVMFTGMSTVAPGPHGLTYILTYSRESSSPKGAAPYKWIPIATGNFDTRFTPQREAPELWRCETVLRILILLRAPNPNRHSRSFYMPHNHVTCHCRLSAS